MTNLHGEVVAIGDANLLHHLRSRLQKLVPQGHFVYSLIVYSLISAKFTRCGGKENRNEKLLMDNQQAFEKNFFLCCQRRRLKWEENMGEDGKEHERCRDFASAVRTSNVISDFRSRVVSLIWCDIYFLLVFRIFRELINTKFTGTHVHEFLLSKTQQSVVILNDCSYVLLSLRDGSERKEQEVCSRIILRLSTCVCEMFEKRAGGKLTSGVHAIWKSIRSNYSLKLARKIKD